MLDGGHFAQEGGTMLPLHTLSEMDLHRSGRRAVAIALKNTAHSIVAIAMRYRRRVQPRRKKCRRYAMIALSVAVVLWSIGVLLPTDKILFTGAASLPLLIGIGLAVRDAIMRDHQRQTEALLHLALHVRDVMDTVALEARPS